MTNARLYLAIGVPMLFNALLIWLLLANINTKLKAFRAEFNARFDAINQRFAAINQRFDDMRDLWRAELRRVQEVLDARLKHLEDLR